MLRLLLVGLLEGFQERDHREQEKNVCENIHCFRPPFVENERSPRHSKART